VENKYLLIVVLILVPTIGFSSIDQIVIQGRNINQILGVFIPMKAYLLEQILIHLD